MSENYEALLVFCEGPHDAAFVQLILKTINGYSQEAYKFSEFPFPFSALFGKTVQDYVAEDLRLDMARKFFLPDHVLRKDKKLVLIFNYGGSTRKESITPFLERLFTLQDGGNAFGGPKFVDRFAYLFMADADDHGLDAAIERISSDFSLILDTPWLSNDWINIENTFGARQKTNGDIGAYIWRNYNSDHGTLECLIEECLEPAGGLKPFLDIADEHFDWKCSDESNKTAVAERAKRLKAAISMMGQRKKPGGSMSVILGQGKFLNTENLSQSPSVQSLLSFMHPWI
ncbi:hypothetical protein [Pseudomonas palleroniana]|uniref:hypothetical protein n=1 Tax=Pseudomonas palleroniana TaxID=191390 RepID=UPI0018E69319|nr:hypothetical protein [Pseudomonas palleroniana]MBI6911636.1 hypothetical protein [Pseudomonas palleroniana]